MKNIIIILLSVLAIACDNKEDLLPASGQKITEEFNQGKIFQLLETSSISGSQIANNVIYNEQGNPISIVTNYLNPTSIFIEEKSMEYTTEGFLSSISHLKNQVMNSKRHFKYDQDGKIIEMHFESYETSGPINPEGETTLIKYFNYDQFGVLENVLSIAKVNGTWVDYLKSEFQYDTNGKIVRILFYNIDEPTPVLKSEISYEYDNQVSIFKDYPDLPYHVFRTYDLGYNRFTVPTDNNLVKITYTNHETKNEAVYQYKYNYKDNGLPIDYEELYNGALVKKVGLDYY